MVLLLKIKRRDFFNETEFLFWCHALWKHCWNCCIFEMKLGTGMEPCTKIYFLFTFNPVNIRIRKTSLFWLCNLMTSLWKPSTVDSITRTPDNSNFFRFPLKVRVIGSRLYMWDLNLAKPIGTPVLHHRKFFATFRVFEQKRHVNGSNYVNFTQLCLNKSTKRFYLFW